MIARESDAELPLFAMVRRSDPGTSLVAAIKAAAASRRTVIAVYELMRDRVPRIDEEIWQGIRDNGVVVSDGSARHGRLVLQQIGVLEPTGDKRDTRLNTASREWVFSERHADLEEAAAACRFASSPQHSVLKTQDCSP